MQTIITTFALLITIMFTTAKAQELEENIAEGTTITVTVPVQSSKGEIVAGLFTEENFMKAAPVAGAKSTIKDGLATLIFENVMPGTYGITILHDTNGNGRMDFEANGMPKENYGVSNNVMNFGPPQWSDAKFEVSTAPLNMEIRL